MYDHYAYLNPEYTNSIVIMTHIIIFLIICFSKCPTSLYGLNGTSINAKETEDKIDLSRNQDQEMENLIYIKYLIKQK